MFFRTGNLDVYVGLKKVIGVFVNFMVFWGKKKVWFGGWNLRGGGLPLGSWVESLPFD
jgi:hypothetical protein